MVFPNIFGRSKELDFNDVAKLIDELTKLKKERIGLLRGLLQQAKKLDNLENPEENKIKTFNDSKNKLAKNLNNELELLINYRKLFLKIKRNIPSLDPNILSVPELKNFITLLDNIVDSIKLFTDKTFEKGGNGVQDQYISLIRDLTQEDKRWVEEGFYIRLKAIFKHNSQRIREINRIHGKISYDADLIGNIKKELKNIEDNKEKIKDRLEGLDKNHKIKYVEKLIFMYLAGVGLVVTLSEIFFGEFMGEISMHVKYIAPLVLNIPYFHIDYYNYKIPDRLEQLMKLTEEASSLYDNKN